ncbi:MAG: hypothetical protein Q7J71_00345 [Polaromonas sp.]|nr:hypothetical protein [Polaromonas sp.]MDO8755860.1 hypothetical protein [Polaromonas sp.]
MTQFRLISLAVALTAVGALTACNTAPAMRMGMGSTSPPSMAASDQMARMDVQMKTMQGMHEKMLNAKTAEERNKLMAEHMKTMQDGMAMMDRTSGAGIGGMKGMPGMGGDPDARQQMMEKRMEMMQTMMKMMMDRMPPASTR